MPAYPHPLGQQQSGAVSLISTDEPTRSLVSVYAHSSRRASWRYMLLHPTTSRKQHDDTGADTALVSGAWQQQLASGPQGPWSSQRPSFIIGGGGGQVGMS